MSDKISLLVMAAGMGSRYGGLKQLDPVGPSGEVLLDYAVYDAKQAGISRVVFLIRKDLEADFRKAIGKRYEGKL
ncbi:MAG: nucleotidyltransferase, partial [Verrucomicrobia bacterium]|nr:nucleotidyltransferase [Verrucomicrobiota bacterium]